MSSNLFNIGTSALLASQRGLSTVGNNIANVNTEGYSRQSVEFAERPPTYAGGDYIGTGVTVDGINRSFDRFINDRLTAAMAASGQQEELQGLASQVDNLLAGEASGLAPALDRFFNSLDDVATDPTDPAARQAALSDAASLEATFGNLAARLDEMRQRNTGQMRAMVNDINDKAASLAELNAEIQAAGSEASNKLLDQRDQLIRELADLVGVDTVHRNTGAIDVFTSSGQALVLGTRSQPLAVSNLSGDPSRPGITVATAGGLNVDISERLSGGRLTALLEFRERFLNPAQNGLGRIALTLTDRFNSQHRLGLDLNGQPGGDLFRPLAASAPRVFSATGNTGTAVVTAQVSDVGALSTSDYELERKGASYVVTRLSDNTTFDVSADLSGGAPASTVVDGVRIDLGSGTLNDGDRFLIQPTREAAARFEARLGDPALLATAAPLRGRTPLTNTGSAALGSVSINNVNNLPLSANGGPITLTFDAAASEFTVSGGPGGTLAYDPATDSGGKTFNFPGYGDVTFSISGVPDDGDQLRLEDNTGAVGDNRNALALASLRSSPTVAGTASFNQAYGEIVADVGTRSRQARIAAEAQGARLDAATAQREAIAGVNLEEEAARLLQLQQHFEAAARAIAVADETFQSLLRAVGG